jgi:hypothetical protein
LLAAAAVIGCGKTAPGPEDPAGPVGEPASPTSAAPLTPEQESLKPVAIAAKDALFGQLVDELMGALSESGPAAAISVCKEEAPRIAQEVGEEYGLDIGRTSFRLRNPENQPPEWARPLVEERVAEPRFVSLNGGDMGAFLPIHLKPTCLMCHGPEEQIPPQVREAVAKNYPQYQAPGFQQGDLRGWFWVAVPADAELPPDASSPGAANEVDAQGA